MLEHKVGRLEAEEQARQWCDPRPVERSNMAGIRKRQQAVVAARTAALMRALVHFASLRVVPDRMSLAARAAVELGGRFPWRSLYDPPYDTMWRESANAPDLHPADRSAMAKDRGRMSRAVLVHRIKRTVDRFDVLVERRRDALIRQSIEEGWEAIPDRPDLPEDSE